METTNLFQKFFQYLWPEQKFQESTRQNTINAIDLLTIDPSIRRLVSWLRSNGFNTGYNGTKPNSHIAMMVNPSELISEAIRLKNLLQTEHGIKVYPEQPEINDKPELDVSYCVVNNVGLLILLRVNDSMLKKKEEA